MDDIIILVRAEEWRHEISIKKQENSIKTWRFRIMFDRSRFILP